jgi:omega-amidase
MRPETAVSGSLAGSASESAQFHQRHTRSPGRAKSRPFLALFRRLQERSPLAAPVLPAAGWDLASRQLLAYGSSVNVIALQHDVVWENKPANFSKVRKLLTQARPPKNSLVVLPEMFATGFSMNTDAIAEGSGGPTEQFLANTAREFGVCLIAGAAMRGGDGRARNQALVFSPAGHLLAAYARMRLFTPGDQPQHCAAGRHPVAFRWGDCTISPFICYDLRFPEIFREAVTAHRPGLIAVLANFPEKPIHHWRRLLQARAIENQV